MKIGWFNDQDPWLKQGGAALTDFSHIIFGIKERGVDIDIVTPSNVGGLIDEDYDLLVLSNCVTFPKETIKHFCKRFPYIVFTHDYYFCKFRLHFSGRPDIKDSPLCLFWKEIHQGAKKNIFLSPLHREMHEIIFDKEVLGKEICIPSNLETDFWKPNPDVKKIRNSVLNINGLAIFKGRYVINDYVKQHPELKFTFAGGGTQLRLPNCQYIGAVTRQKLRELYWQHEYVMLLPETSQPCERVACEALLCGNKILYNDNVGLFSFPWNFKDRKEVRNLLRQAGPGFWDEVYEVYEQEKKK